MNDREWDIIVQGLAAAMTSKPGKETGPQSTGPLRPNFTSEGPSLSEVNPLFNPLKVDDPAAVDAFRTVTLGLIDRYGGLRPNTIKSLLVPSLGQNTPPAYRFIARFEVSDLTPEKIEHLENLVKHVYGPNSRTRRNTDGVEMPTVTYPPADTQSVDEMVNTRFEGWYMGPTTTALDTLHKGVYLFKDVGVTNVNTFLDKARTTKDRYIVEIREEDLYQTDLANLVVETAAILGTGKLVDYGQLLYDGYYSLIRSGLKRREEGYDIEEILRPVRRGLIYPLANPGLAKALNQEPESALLAGVPGTGKSLAATQLLYEDTGLFLIPMDPMQVAGDIAKAPDKRTIIPRIAQVRRLTGRGVILQLDDVEKLFDKENKTSSALLNLMAGVQEQGFFVLASTNDPEKIDPALLQPQRLGIRVYCGLPSEGARMHILEKHTPVRTPEGQALFGSDDIRRIILEYIAQNTESFPPRQLAKVATNAKAALMAWVVQKQGRVLGLGEEDLGDSRFQVEHWETALAETLATFDRDEVKKRDGEIRKFIVKHERAGMGYQLAQITTGKSFDEVRRRIAVAEAASPAV